MHFLHDVFSWGMAGYFAAINLTYTALLVLGSRQVSEWVRRRPLRDFRQVGESSLATPVTIIVPAYNEAPVIVASVRSLLASRFAELEVLVVNDGSTDDTLARLTEAFDLVPVERVPRSNLPSARVRGIYASPHESRLTVVDKDNAGKADALNCGIAFAAYPLFCSIDSDTMLDPGALARLVWTFQAEPETVATGGIVRIVNGSTVSEQRVERVHTPRHILVNVQIMEYLRAFFGGRAGWSRAGMVVIISGAFGLFRRDVVVDAGGYDPDTVGEDAELVVRLHRHCRERGMKYRISFMADPICWTEAPGDFKTLCRQRDRWQRGLIEVLWKHRGMFGRRRYGRIGLVAMPYYLFFEALGPVIEAIGLLYLAAALVFGFADPHFVLVVGALGISYGLILSLAALLIESRAFARHPSWTDIGRLVWAAVFENVGYRQFMAFVRARAWLTMRRPGRGWGEMTRAGFTPEPAALPAGPGAPSSS